jgi:chloramphenicol-sensitive protein RarD
LKKGILFAAAAYILWGVFPAYFKLLQSVPAIQIVGHRIIWSFIFLVALVAIRRELPALKAATTPRILGLYLIAGILLSVNWLVYVGSVNAGFVVEASLGYFINPLVSVLLGTLFLKEKLRPWQWVPVGLAALGVVYLTVSLGKLPWISLVLAFTFGLYGLMKKLTPLGSLHGLTLETVTIFIPALAFLLFCQANGTGAFGHASLLTNLLLALTGVVTAIPLLLFSAGAQRVPLSTMGLLQYFSPTLQFLFGVFMFGEPFDHNHLIGFSIIWAALIVFSVESYLAQRKIHIQATLKPEAENIMGAD